MELNDKIVIYRSEDGETQLEVRINQDTVWLNAYQIAELFGRDSKTIRKHIANAIKEELAGEVVVANFASSFLLVIGSNQKRVWTFAAGLIEC